MKIKFLAILIFVSLTSCTSSEPDGLCSSPIVLSDNDIEFSAEENSVMVTATVPFGWINHIKFGDTDYEYEGEILSSSEFVIEEDSFIIERNDQTLNVKINKNETDLERILFVGLQNGNCTGSLIITQAAN